MDDSFRRGLRLGVPYAAVATVLALSFGVLAVQAGFTPVQTIALSALVFGGSAQFTALTIVGAGGGIGAAVGAATLMHSRFLAMGIALAPSLSGGPLRRAAEGQIVVDSSWALASRGDGTFDRGLLFGTTVPQYVGWVIGTVIGAYGGTIISDPGSLGLDALFPTFFVGILIAELRKPRARVAALLGAAIALALVPLTPAGVPVLAASAAALVGLGRLDPAPDPEVAA
ncbi:AzlC family ABC transporter permease [Nocardioides coralli]|uniref:AzlC family ABC transporter permease n=1 Tax=Nocardioides coralli TaxID=2872154 RepID=UPI001CA3B352|nr:AzlC family ABC transporter permease [Nocardioides coralli]QZY28580.1 AzlC family ABC transporter permease [Nocardioides coralli]